MSSSASRVRIFRSPRPTHSFWNGHRTSPSTMPRKRKPKRRTISTSTFPPASSINPTTRFAFTFAKWASCPFSIARARSPSQNASSAARSRRTRRSHVRRSRSSGCCRSARTSIAGQASIRETVVFSRAGRDLPRGGQGRGVHALDARGYREHPRTLRRQSLKAWNALIKEQEKAVPGKKSKTAADASDDKIARLRLDIAQEIKASEPDREFASDADRRDPKDRRGDPQDRERRSPRPRTSSTRKPAPDRKSELNAKIKEAKAVIAGDRGEISPSGRRDQAFVPDDQRRRDRDEQSEA